MNAGRVGDSWQPFPKVQLDVTTAIAAELVKAYKIPEIVGHCHIAAATKHDPGPLFPFAEMQRAIYGRAAELPACQ